MSRDASTTERTEEIVLGLTSPNFRVAAILEVWDGTQYLIVDDVDMQKGIDWTESGKNDKFSDFALTPLASETKFGVVNRNGQYSDGSGTSFENLFDLNTKIRLKAGYLLSTTGDESTTSLNLNNITGTTIKSFFHHTLFNTSGEVQVTGSSISVQPTHFTDKFFNYDSINYDSATYSPDAYTVHTYDTEAIGHQNIVSFDITANNTEGTVYWRVFNATGNIGSSQFTNWTSAGDLVSGTKTVTIGKKERFLQVAVLYDGLSSWDETLEISDITVTHASFFEQIYTSVYYLDSPSFSEPKSPEMPLVQCRGRDNFRRFITLDVNYTDVSGLDIDDIIKSIADKANVPYTATSIADLSSFGARTTLTVGNTEVVKATKLLEQCMQIINTTGYVMYLEYDAATDDNVLFVQLRPALADTTGAMSFKNYESLGGTKKNHGKIINRITAITDTQVVDADVQLDSDTFSTTGAKVLGPWTAAEFKRLVVDSPDEVTISGLSVTPTGITFTIDTLSTSGVTFTVFGNNWTSTAPKFEGEAMDFDNMVRTQGSTTRIINPLFISDAECKSVAESFANDFGIPIFEAKSLKWPYLNLFNELNEGQTLFRRFIGADDIFIITKISHHIDNAPTPNNFTTYNLEDSGSDYSDLGGLNYDGVVDFDKGHVIDSGVAGPLDTPAEIDAASDALAVFDVDFA